MSDVINRNGEILKMTLADFSQDEMLTRPVPGANPATWQIGHMIGSASHMFAAIAPGLPGCENATAPTRIARANRPADSAFMACLLTCSSVPG